MPLIREGRYATNDSSLSCRRRAFPIWHGTNCGVGVCVSLDRLCARRGVHSGGLGRPRTLTALTAYMYMCSVDTGRRRPLTLLTPERRVLRKATAFTVHTMSPDERNIYKWTPGSPVARAAAVGVRIVVLHIS